jgi:hypothetical protein
MFFLTQLANLQASLVFKESAITEIMSSVRNCLIDGLKNEKLKEVANYPGSLKTLIQGEKLKPEVESITGESLTRPSEIKGLT